MGAYTLLTHLIAQVEDDAESRELLRVSESLRSESEEIRELQRLATEISRPDIAYLTTT